MIITLNKNSNACPEQYDAFYNNKQVGYLRLRNGYFTVKYPDVDGELIYESEKVKGNGSFEDSERDYFLGIAKVAIINKINEEFIKDNIK